MKSMTQGTTPSTLERTCARRIIKSFTQNQLHNYASFSSQLDYVTREVLIYLHSKVPQVDQIVPVLNVRSGDHQLLLLPGLLAVVGVPEEPHHGLTNGVYWDIQQYYNSFYLNESEYGVVGGFGSS